MSKTTRQALYERLRKTQAQEITTTCSRAELPLLRQHVRRLGWHLHVLSGEQTVTVQLIK